MKQFTGQITNVRRVKTRGVSVIEIEVPIDFHDDATPLRGHVATVQVDTNERAPATDYGREQIQKIRKTVIDGPWACGGKS